MAEQEGTKKLVDKRAEIDKMLDLCTEFKGILTTWERSFLASITNYHNRAGFLSTKQETTLIKLYDNVENYIADNYQE